MTGAVLIPVKAFDQAKARLSAGLSPTQRRTLAHALACAVVESIRDHDAGIGIHIACDDDEVASWAQAAGASVVWGAGLGLNGAIDSGIASLAAGGIDRVAVIHADLTRPERLAHLLGTHLDASPPSRSGHPDTPPTVVLVPDQHRDGTNIVIEPTREPLPASYGPGSFNRHLSMAMERSRSHGWSITISYDALLGLDIDTVDDLAHPLAARWRHEISQASSAGAVGEPSTDSPR